MQVILDLCVVPLGVGVSVSRYVAECHRVLQEAGLKHQLHAYGTNIEGEWDEVMAAVKLSEGAALEPGEFREFLAEQPDLGPKQWPSYVRIAGELPRTETFKVIKRVLTAEALDCADPVFRVEPPPRGGAG